MLAFRYTHTLVENQPVLKVEKLKQLWSYGFAEDKKKKRLMSRVLNMSI